jgi:DNA-binding NarL/FixJ family response regulator
MSLTPRQAQVASLVAKGLPTKGVAREMGLSVETVQEYIQNAAKRLPGDGHPRAKLLIWFFDIRKTP